MTSSVCRPTEPVEPRTATRIGVGTIGWQYSGPRSDHRVNESSVAYRVQTGLLDGTGAHNTEGMFRGAVLTLTLVVAVPLCLVVGAVAGYYLLFLLYVVFGIDFPTEISLLVGLSPIVLSIIVVSRFLTDRSHYNRMLKDLWMINPEPLQ